MPDDYIPTTVPFSELAPGSEQIPVPPYIPPKRKKFPWIVSLLLLLLVFMAVMGIYLFFQIRELNNQLATPASPIPLATVDPMADWQTFRVDGIELKLPRDWVDLKSTCHKIEINKSDATALELDIREYIKQEEGFSDISNLDQLMAEVDQKHLITFNYVTPENIATLGPLGEGDLNNIYIRGPEGTGYYRIHVTYAGPVPDISGVCLGAKESEYRQVLSTLKFSASGNPANYTCPAAEWVDCMPGPDTGLRLECTEEYLTWARANCPGFKGAAL